MQPRVLAHIALLRSSSWSTIWGGSSSAALAMKGIVLLTSRPWRGWRQAIFDVDTDHAIAVRPQHDVVVEGTVGLTLVAADHAAAMHEHEDRPPGAGAFRHEQIERVALMRPVFHIVSHLDARIGLRGMHGHIERRGLGGIADPADGGDLVDELGRDLSQGRSGDEQKGGDRVNALEHGLPPGLCPTVASAAIVVRRDRMVPTVTVKEANGGGVETRRERAPATGRRAADCWTARS